MQDVRWLFFDLGNTLVSEDAATKCRYERLAAALERHGRRCSIAEIDAAFHQASAEFAPHLIIAALEQLVDDAETRAAVLAEARYPKELEAPYHGVAPLLRGLSATYRIGVIANQSVSSTERLTRWGLMPFISTCLCSFELGIEKPDPAIFELAIERARCEPSQAVMIGDRLDNDIRPTRVLGWKTIRVMQGPGRVQSPRDQWDEPDLTVDSVCDVARDCASIARS